MCGQKKLAIVYVQVQSRYSTYLCHFRKGERLITAKAAVSVLLARLFLDPLQDVSPEPLVAPQVRPDAVLG